MAEQVLPSPKPDALFDWLWEKPNADEEAGAEQRKEVADVADELNRDILSTFSTAAGKRVWEWLWQGTILQPTFMADYGYDLGTAYGFARDGQNRLIMDLHRRMTAARDGRKGKR